MTDVYNIAFIYIYIYIVFGGGEDRCFVEFSLWLAW